MRTVPSLRQAAIAVVVVSILVIYVLMSAGVRWTYPAADAEAYWLAATNLRAGNAIYAECPDCADTYRYAPWFAFTWVPLTFLPKTAVMVTWVAAMIAVTLLSLYPLAQDWRPEGLVVGVIIGTQLLYNAWMGNVHSLMLLPLIYGVER